MKKPMSSHQILEVAVTKSIRCNDVKWGKIIVARARGGTRTCRLTKGGEIRVSFLNVGPKGGATRLTDFVGAREGGHVASI